MILNLVDRRTDRTLPEPTGDWFTQRLDRLKALAGQVGPDGWAVDLVLVDDEHMAGLNRRFRGHDGVTDVLSFSYLVEPAGGPVDLEAGRHHAACDLALDPSGFPAGAAAGEPAVVGEVILAPGFAVRRCEQNGWSVAGEIPMLVVHGLLHVLGWEHDDERKRQAMQDIEEAVLASRQLTHPLRPRS